MIILTTATAMVPTHGHRVSVRPANRAPRVFCLVALALFLGACKSSQSSTSPTPVVANRSPVIASITVTPLFGVGPMTPLEIVAAASDLDGDSLTYSWTITNGTLTVGTYTGATLHPSFMNPLVAAVAHVTVTDGKGGTATKDSERFVVGSLNGGGGWEAQSLVAFPQTSLFYLRLFQDANGNLSGQVINSHEVTTGTIDAGGTINAAGRVSNLRLRLAGNVDITINGQLQPDGQHIVGTFSGPGVISGKALNGLPVNLIIDNTVH